MDRPKNQAVQRRLYNKRLIPPFCLVFIVTGTGEPPLATNYMFGEYGNYKGAHERARLEREYRDEMCNHKSSPCHPLYAMCA